MGKHKFHFINISDNFCPTDVAKLNAFLVVTKTSLEKVAEKIHFVREK
jgi:hypothetical protein